MARRRTDDYVVLVPSGGSVTVHAADGAAVVPVTLPRTARVVVMTAVPVPPEDCAVVTTVVLRQGGAA